ncbi:hypothetical protein KQI84_14225 [bacterium]|nr:hypothetical protein [bacterium]
MKKRRRTPTPPEPGARLLKVGESALQPDVWELHRDGNRVVWKTFRESNRAARATLCRWLARREARNLRLLDGLPRTPRLLGMPEPWTIEMTWLDAEPVAESKTGHGIDGDWFDELESMLAEIHRRGMNHGDLRRKNMMKERTSGQPCLVDVAQSMVAKGGSLFDRLIMRQAQQVDRVTFLKLKAWYLGPDVLTAEEKAEFAAAPWHLRVGQFLKKKIYRPYKHWRRGKRRPKKGRK